jgi:cytochrome P450
VLDRAIRDELAERRARGDHGPGALGLLLAATDEHGAPLSDAEIRDQAITLLFAGHDTTTSTFTFLAYELGRAPAARDRVERELDAVLGEREPAPADLDGTALPELERALEETLRRYPPAWVGPRRTVRDVEICGVPIPAGIPVHYSSWATHHLPAVFEDPLAFVPDRFLPDRAAALPRGAYVPFGGGSRMCLGKRFGQYELRTLAAVLLRRLRFSPDPGAPLRIVTTPTLGPASGLWFDVRPR